LYSSSTVNGVDRTDERFGRRVCSAALTDAHPKHRYRVGLGAGVVLPIVSKLPSFWTDWLVAFTFNRILVKPKGFQQRLAARL